MSSMRNRTIRNKIDPKTLRKPSKEDKLRAIRALYIVVFNGEESIIPWATELFHSIGDILEGTPIDRLNLHRVPRDRVLKTYAELANK